MSQEELEAIEVAFRRRRELEDLEREDFLEWIHEAAEAEEKAELKQRIRNLELENESLQGFEQEHVEHTETREDFEKDLMLSDEAEVFSEMLADEEICEESNDDAELTDPECQPEGTAESEAEEEQVE